MDLIKKYAPIKTSEIVGNDTVIKKLIDDLKGCKSEYRGVVKGVSGSGKSTIPKVILEELGYGIIGLESAMLTGGDSSTAEFTNVLKNFTNTARTIDNIMFKRQNVLFIDGIDDILQMNKVLYQQCVTVFKSSAKQPIIVTYNTTNEKKLAECFRHQKIPKYNVSAPNQFQIRLWVNKVMEEQNIHLEDEGVLYKYLGICQNKIGKILLNIQGMESFVKQHTTHINSNDMFVDRYTTEIASDICAFPDKYNLKQLDNIMNYDQFSISTCIHENINTVISERCEKGQEQIDFLLRMSDIYTDADIVEEYIYTNREWSLSNTLMLSKLGMIKCAISQYPKRNSLYRQFEFSPLLSNFTSQSGYYKQDTNMLIYNDMSDANFGLIEWHNILLACAIIAENISKDNAKQCVSKGDIDILNRYVKDSQSDVLKQSSSKIEGIIKSFARKTPTPKKKSTPKTKTKTTDNPTKTTSKKVAIDKKTTK